ncbi:MAG: hypothetical protein ABI759_07680 [Candidatus Solibacter sp.]
MNDAELDELLSLWITPAPAATLREAAWSRYVHPPSNRLEWLRGPLRVLGRHRLAASVGCAALVLFGVAQALPQALNLTPYLAPLPYVVESNFIRPSEDGPQAVESSMLSYMDQYGSEIVLSTTFPGHGWRTVFRRTLDGLGFILMQVSLPFRNGAEKQRRMQVTQEMIRSDCSRGGAVVGFETILNYPATAVALHENDHEKLTMWRAPALGCFPLRVLSEVANANGKYQVAWWREAVRVMK